MTLLSKSNPIKSNLINSNLITGLLVSAIVSMAGGYISIANAAPIYKVVDEQTGQVTFTDNPQSYMQQAGKQISQTGVTTGNSTSNNASSTRLNNDSSNTDSSSSNNTLVLNAQSATALPALTQSTPQINYQLTMIEPSKERAYQRPAQSIVIALQTRPNLQAGDYAVIYLDGNEVARGLNVTIATVNLAPGEHKIQAIVNNARGQRIQQVERTVYVIQNTAILRNKKQLALQLQAYQRLSLREKLLLKLRQRNTSGQ